MNFTILEKMSILKALDEVLLADGNIHRREVTYLNQVMDIFDVDMDFVSESRNLNSAHASSTLKSMDSVKKGALGVMLKEMASADGEIGMKELEVMFAVLDAAGIK